MDQPICAVVSAPLADGLGITLAKGGDGWRFHGWHRSEYGAPPLPPPAPAERERWFGSPLEALAHFRSLYGARSA
jgi:hypothetical protein